MGVVYRGHDQRLRRPVCIKIFHQLSENSVVQRTTQEHFVQEAFALSQLTHPNTLRIYDFGHLAEGGAPFQVSELLEGGTLGRLVRRVGPLSPQEALELLQPIGDALSEAHARGIIHRDIKPSNILLADLGARRIAKLGDFGIAKTPTRSVRGAGAPPPPNMRLYSPGWAAPEQLRNQPVSPLTDVFSLGLVLAYALGGQPVFATQDGADRDERKVSDAHVAARVQAMGVFGQLAEVVCKACRERPEERYESAEHLATALRQAVSGRASLLPPPPSFERASLVPAVVSERPSAPSLAEPGDGQGVSGPQLRASFFDASVELEHDAPERWRIGERHVVGLPLVGSDQIDLGGPEASYTRGRVRVTLLPSLGQAPSLNVKGLSCFVTRAGGRPSTAVEVEREAEVSLLAPDRQNIDTMRCAVAQVENGTRSVRCGDLTVVLKGAFLDAVLVDIGPGRDLLLIYRSAAMARMGGRP